MLLLFHCNSGFPGKGGELAGVGGNVVRLQFFQSEQEVLGWDEKYPQSFCSEAKHVKFLIFFVRTKEHLMSSHLQFGGQFEWVWVVLNGIQNEKK